MAWNARNLDLDGCLVEDAAPSRHQEALATAGEHRKSPLPLPLDDSPSRARLLSLERERASCSVSLSLPFAFSRMMEAARANDDLVLEGLPVLPMLA